MYRWRGECTKHYSSYTLNFMLQVCKFSIRAALASISLNQRQGPMVLETLNITLKKTISYCKKPEKPVVHPSQNNSGDRAADKCVPFLGRPFN